MKVYTHYLEEGACFRWRTLLQFGNSWDIIGSVVMKNPGTAAPKCQVTDKNTLKLLSFFDNTMYDWFEFSPDSTMNCVGDLFAYYYDKSNKNDLQGVVQIFNLFYLREGDLGKALELHKKNKFPFASEEEIIQNDISQLKAPIYLGFAGLAFDKYYADRAKRFLDASLMLGMNYLSPNISENKYVHPQYLMLFGKYSATSIKARMQFKQNSLQPMGLDKALADIPKKFTNTDLLKITESITSQLKETGYQEYEPNRFVITEDIGMSVLKDGYIGCRPQMFRGYNYYSSNGYRKYIQFDKFIEVLNTLGYDTSEEQQLHSWFGRKHFLDYGASEAEIVAAIKREIVEIQNLLNS